MMSRKVEKALCNKLSQVLQEWVSKADSPLESI